jgi:hypothetical protein
MAPGTRLDDDHECRGSWVLSEGDIGSEFEEVVAHEDPAGRFVNPDHPAGSSGAVPLDEPMARLYLETIGRLALVSPTQRALRRPRRAHTLPTLAENDGYSTASMSRRNPRDSADLTRV